MSALWNETRVTHKTSLLGCDQYVQEILPITVEHFYSKNVYKLFLQVLILKRRRLNLSKKESGSDYKLWFVELLKRNN